MPHHQEMVGLLWHLKGFDKVLVKGRMKGYRRENTRSSTHTYKRDRVRRGRHDLCNQQHENSERQQHSDSCKKKGKGENAYEYPEHSPDSLHQSVWVFDKWSHSGWVYVNDRQTLKQRITSWHSVTLPGKSTLWIHTHTYTRTHAVYTPALKLISIFIYPPPRYPSHFSNTQNLRSALLA